MTGGPMDREQQMAQVVAMQAVHAEAFDRREAPQVIDGADMATLEWLGAERLHEESQS